MEDLILPGSLQDLLFRSCTVQDHARTSSGGIYEDLHKSPFTREFTMNMPQAQGLRTWRRRLCASLRGRNAHGHLTRAILRENSQGKSRGPRSGEPSVADFVRACAVMGTPQEQARESTGKRPEIRWSTLI